MVDGGLVLGRVRRGCQRGNENRFFRRNSDCKTRNKIKHASFIESNSSGPNRTGTAVTNASLQTCIINVGLNLITFNMSVI